MKTKWEAYSKIDRLDFCTGVFCYRHNVGHAHGYAWPQLTYIWSVGFHHVVRVGVLELMMISAHTVYWVADVHVVLMLCTLLAGDVLVYIYIYIYV